LPIAPGTWGTIPAVGLHLAADLVLPSALAVFLVLGALTVAASLLCLAFGSAAERTYGQKDPSPVVLDELAGYCLAASVVRFLFPTASIWPLAGLLFLTSRVFDVAKPFPARRCQRLAGGVGILLDDLAVAPYAVAATALLLWLFRF